MKKIFCFILATVLFFGVFPISSFAAENILYRATVDVISSECSYGKSQVYFYEDDCYMFIDDIVRYTRSAYTVEGDILTITHGSRVIKIDLTNNKMTEDVISTEIKTLRNGDYIVVHAFPMLSYLGATCSYSDNKLNIWMPECTIWEGLTRDGYEFYISEEIFGDEGDQRLRLAFNGILSIFDGGLGDLIFNNTRKDAMILALQVDPLQYAGAWEIKNLNLKKTDTLVEQAVGYRDISDDITEWGKEMGESTANNIVFEWLKGVLIGSDDWGQMDGLDKGIMASLTLNKFASFGKASYVSFCSTMSSYKKCAKDSLKMLEALSNYSMSDKYNNTILSLAEELSVEGEAEIEAKYEALGSEIVDNFLEDLSSILIDKKINLKSYISFTGLLKASVDISSIFYKKFMPYITGEDAFAYSASETAAIELLYWREETINAMEELADKIYKSNYSNEEYIEDWRLINALYYKIQIAINIKIEEMIVAQGRQNDTDMAPIIEQLHTNSEAFSKNLYILTTANGTAYPDVKRISETNEWDENSAIKENAKKVPNGLEGLGVDFQVVLSGFEADSIQYYYCKPAVDFFVFEKNKKYGLVNSNGEIILPAEYQSIEPHETSPSGEVIKLYAYDFNYQGYWIEQDGSLNAEYLPGWGFEGGVEIYWYGGKPIMFEFFEGKVPYSYEVYKSYRHGSNVLGAITKGTHDVIPIQKIDGYKQTTYGWETTYTVDKVSEKYALFNLKTQKLLTDFIFDDYGYSGFVEGILPVSQGDKWGYINEEGEMITDFIYDTSEVTPWGNKQMYSSLNNYIIVRQGDLFGLINNKGDEVVKVEYSGISRVNENGIFWTCTDGTWSLCKLEK